MNGPPSVVGIPEFWAAAYEVNPAGFDAIVCHSDTDSYACDPTQQELTQVLTDKLNAEWHPIFSETYQEQCSVLMRGR